MFLFLNFIKEKSNSERLSYQVTKLISGSQTWLLGFNDHSFRNPYKRLFVPPACTEVAVPAVLSGSGSMDVFKQMYPHTSVFILLCLCLCVCLFVLLDCFAL